MIRKEIALWFLAGILFLQLSAIVSLGHTDASTQQLLGPRERVQMLISGSMERGKMVTKIEPFNSPRLHRFTLLTWVNNANVPVRIKLGPGPKCQEVTDMRLREVDWRDEQACYMSQPIAPGSGLDIYLQEEGRYLYEIEYLGEKAVESGTITVY